MRFLFAYFFLSLLAPASAQAAAACKEGEITVTGIVREPGTLQEEPQETPQTSFMLLSPSCGNQAILVSGPAYGIGPVCRDGDRAEATGRYLPPDGITAMPILDGAKAVCRKP